MLRVQQTPSLSGSTRRDASSSPTYLRLPAPTRLVHCRAQHETTPEEALQSGDSFERRRGLTELVRQRPEDGGKDAVRCSLLARFVRTNGSADQHALLDAVDVYGVSPRMLPVFCELMKSGSPTVRLRAAPALSALIGLYRVVGRDRHHCFGREP